MADVLVENDLSEIEYEENGRRIYLSRQRLLESAPSKEEAVRPAPPPPQAPAEAPHPQTPAPSEPPPEEPHWENHPGLVRSPMVGTVYRTPEPGAPPFINVGDHVKAGQTLLIIEAMKVLNPIKAPHEGKVLAVLVESKAPVEFDDPIVVIAP
ncbi:acetyl-CoA carboxylase, biotin carboxyl carrier protein [Alphaproteobacteria bacterium]|nr:acetyl-CoA carboxylase, biotin carboxyl carrier protein [Alphaproteobacteria bacterium]GHS99133.1 acetyl-CoA carboxylase, biotin carboxyl carrier protein [Alphaproteobacteria bacterium]